MRIFLMAVCLLLTLQASSQVEKIRILSIHRLPQLGYIAMSVQYKVLIPNPLGSSAQAWRILKSYSGSHNIIRIDTIGAERYAVIVPNDESISLPKTKNQIRNILTANLTQYQNKMNNLVSNLEGYDSMLGESYIDSIWQLSPTIDSL